MASVAKRAKLGEDFGQTFYDTLKCHICESRLKAGKHRWYRCTQPHMICQDCKEVKEKNYCSCDYLISFEHCKVIESLLNVKAMKFKCENLARGCQESLDKENMICHQTECIYRLVKCPRIPCKSKVPFHELFDHMVENNYHNNAKPLTRNEAWGKRNKFKYFFTTIEVKNKIFFGVSKIQDGVFYYWIYLHGSSQEAKNYSYTLEYSDVTEDEVICNYKAKVVSIDETVNSIIENGNCFGIPRKLFEKKFNPKDDEFKYFVTIRSLKEEVKDENVESGVSDVDE